MNSEDLYVREGVIIPASELSFRSARASGPGGQHVNKSNTKVQLSWVPAQSVTLNDEQRALVLFKLQHRLNKRGELTCAAEGHRSQQRNSEEARDRLAALVRAALTVPKKRVPTRRTRASKERRLRSKRERGQVKSQRRQRDWS